MKISEMITKLEALKAEHGDLEVIGRNVTADGDMTNRRLDAETDIKVWRCSNPPYIEIIVEA